MPQARDQAGNIWETDAQGNATRLIQAAGAAGGQATVIRNPWKAKEEARKDEDQANERIRIQIAQDANNRQADATAAQIANMNKPPVGYRWGPPDAQGNPTMQIIPGGPADKSSQNALTSAQRIELETKRGTLKNLSSGIAALRKQYEDNFKGRGASEYLPAIARPENGVFNDTSGSLSAYVAAALGLSGQQFNTPAEQQLFIGSILPKAGDTDQQIENKLNRLDELMGNADQASASLLGVKPGQFSGNAPPPPAGGAGGNGGGNPGPYQNDPSGNRTFLTERDKAFAAESQDAFRNGADRAALDAIAQKYGAQPFGPELDKAIEARRAGSANVQFAPTPTGFEEAGLTGAVMGPWASGNLGSYAIGAGNAVTAGQLGNIAEMTGSSEGGTDVAMGMAQDNAAPYFLGELTGGAAATALTGMGLGAGSRLIANPTVATLLANPLTADAAYGAAYGASSADDPLYGAVGGALTAMGGSYLGGRAGDLIGGLRTPTGGDPLNRGERAVMDALNRTGPIPVENALQNAADLGVPASLADVSPDVGSLAGAAIRRSPSAAGMARDVLSRRSQGQMDRFRGAVARDLGPVENIPQLSEDLIAQARVAAGPLYDAAYSAPGATTLDIADLLARPSMTRAYGPASRIAAEEGRDPLALGFRFDANSNAIGIEAPSWQTIDYMKRGLDDVVQGSVDPNTRKLTTEGGAVNNTRKELLGRVDAMNPDYAAARNAYAGPMQERGFLEAGQEAVSASPNQLAVDVAGLSPQRIQQMQLGAQSRLVENAERLRNSSNPFGTLNTPAMEQRLSALYPDAGDDVARLLAQRDLELQMAGSTNRLIGNSFTAERGVADQAFSQDGLLRPMIEGAAETAITGAPVATILRSGIGQRVADAFSMGTGRRAIEKADQIAPVALNTDPADVIAQILAMQERTAAYDAAKEALRRGSVRPGQIAGTAGVTATYPYIMGD